MTSLSVIAAISRFRGALAQTFGGRLRELVLFGSHARGEAHEDSDVDLLVVIDGLTDLERGQVFDLAHRADAADPEGWVGLSPLPYSVEQVRDLRDRERLLLRDVDREGIPL